MNSYNYFESLKFDKMRVMKKNEGRVCNLNKIKVIGSLRKKKKYNYVYLDDKIVEDRDIIIVIDNDLLRIDILKEIEMLDKYLNDYNSNVNFF